MREDATARERAERPPRERNIKSGCWILPPTLVHHFGACVYVGALVAFLLRSPLMSSVLVHLSHDFLRLNFGAFSVLFHLVGAMR